jgi:hypothetical protein
MRTLLKQTVLIIVLVIILAQCLAITGKLCTASILGSLANRTVVDVVEAS